MISSSLDALLHHDLESDSPDAMMEPAARASATVGSIGTDAPLRAAPLAISSHAAATEVASAQYTAASAAVVTAVAAHAGSGPAPAPALHTGPADAPQTLVVTTLTDENDSGASVGSPGGSGLSLREALTIAAGDGSGDTIVFDPSLSGGTTTLNAAFGGLTIANGVTIDGDIDGNGTPDITISGGGAVRPFFVTSTGALSLNGVTVSGGLAQGGAGQAGAEHFSSFKIGAEEIDQFAFSGGSGGGLGAGGAIFLASGASLSLSNDIFQSDKAAGGAGGAGGPSSPASGFGVDGGLGPYGSAVTVGAGSTNYGFSGGAGGFGNGGGSGGGGEDSTDTDPSHDTANVFFFSGGIGGAGGFGAGGGGRGATPQFAGPGGAGGFGGGAGGGNQDHSQTYGPFSVLRGGAGGGGAGMGGAIFGAEGATISIGAGVSFGGDVVQAGAGGSAGSVSYPGQAGSAGSAFGGDIFLMGGALAFDVAGGQTQTIGAGIVDATGYNANDAVSVTKSGDGTLVLGGANSFTGAFTASGGILQVTGVETAASLTASDTSITGGGHLGAVDLQDGANLSMTGIVGQVTVESGGELAMVGGTAGNVTVQSGGVVNMTGTVATVQVATGGDFALAGTAGAVTADISSSIDLAGTAGVVTLGASDQFSIGGATDASLTTTGLTLASGVSANFNLDGGSAGQFDVVHVNGTVNLAGATLDLEVGAGASFTPGQNLILIQNDGVDAVQGTFAGLANASIVDFANRDFLLLYTGGDGNDVSLIVLPNQAPKAIADAGAVLSFGHTSGNVVANDYDAESDRSSLVVTQVAAGANTVAAGSVLQGSYGHLTLLASGAYTYFPDAASGLLAGDVVHDDFIYTLADPLGATATATLDIAITGRSIGGAGADQITGNGADNLLSGLGGDDSLDGGGGSNTLAGGAGDDLLVGHEGHDVLNGGVGVDTMEGGDGNDIYYVDNAADVVIEVAGGGRDTVLSSVSYTLAAGSAVDILASHSPGDLSLAGNELANTIDGGLGDDHLYGGDGADSLNAGAAGLDTLEGGADNDIYRIGHAGVTVVEAAGQGTDTVMSSVSFTLPDNVEILRLTGTGDIDGTGGAQANRIIGNTGDNVIDGGGGADSLTGGGGADTFVFDSVADTPRVGGDHILDLTASDLIDLHLIDADTTTSGDQAFTLVGAFDHHAGEMTLVYNATTNVTHLSMDVDGDGKIDAMITLLGDHHDFNNFVL